MSLGLPYPTPLVCPTCGGLASALHSQGGRMYERDAPQPMTYWLEPCGHPVTREFFDAYVVQVLATAE